MHPHTSHDSQGLFRRLVLVLSCLGQKIMLRLQAEKLAHAEMSKCLFFAPRGEPQGQEGGNQSSEQGRAHNLCNGRYSQSRHRALVLLLLSGMDGKEQISDWRISMTRVACPTTSLLLLSSPCFIGEITCDEALHFHT